METTTVNCCRCNRTYTGPKHQPFRVTCHYCGILIQYRPNEYVTYHVTPNKTQQISHADRMAIDRKSKEDAFRLILAFIAIVVGIALYLHFRNANDQTSVQMSTTNHRSQQTVITMPQQPAQPLYPLKTYRFYKIAYNWQFYKNQNGNFEKCDTNDQRENKIRKDWQSVIDVTNGITVKCYSDYADMVIDEDGQLKSLRLQTQGNYLYETKVKQFSIRLDVSNTEFCTLYLFNDLSATSIESTPDN